MKLFVPAVLLGLATLSAPALGQGTPAAAPAAAQPAKSFIPGLATANVQDVIVASNAFINANQERQIVYKNQFAMAEARRRQINAQITPLVAKFNSDRQGGKVPPAELQAQARAIQNLQQSGARELQAMRAPITLSETYVREQIGDAINQAIVNAMDKRGITFVVPPQNVLAHNNAYNISPVVLAELNAILPVAKVAPPEGWQPKAVREAQAAQQAQLEQGDKPSAAAPRPPRRRD